MAGHEPTRTHGSSEPESDSAETSTAPAATVGEISTDGQAGGWRRLLSRHSRNMLKHPPRPGLVIRQMTPEEAARAPKPC